ncbi:nucleoside triphosphate pyrophosphohydrolase [Lentibacillus halophilus]|uniref:Nucleoside triphosphate pyrophosphohydrolase n=1 Tax=Lentibacillus halophilus TaxID=295065 RepID=A0ABN0ZHD8_9BACI
MPTYNKLVRDRIPEIIKRDGKQATTDILDSNHYIAELKSKLHEEVAEYQDASTDADSLEELADILEIMHALSKTHGASIENVEAIRQEKARKRGGFDDKIYLIEVDDT